MANTVGIDLTYVHDINKIGGEELIALNLITGFNATNFMDSYYIIADKKVATQLKEKSIKLPFIETKKKSKSFYNKVLPRLAKKSALDIVFYPHAHKEMNMKIKSKKVVLVHGINSKDNSKRDRNKIINKLLKADKIICVSDFVKEELLALSWKFTKMNIQVILNPISDIRSGVEIVFKKKYILCISDGTKSKNDYKIVKAYQSMLSEIDHELIIIGNISEKSKTYKFIKKYAFSHKVVVTGIINRDILFGYYKNADLYVNASNYEGFGLTPLEAMVSKTRVISTYTPSILAIDSIECDEYIRKNDSYLDLATKMIKVLKTPIDKDYAKIRRDKILKFYSLNKACKEYIKVFESL